MPKGQKSPVPGRDRSNYAYPSRGHGRYRLEQGRGGHGEDRGQRPGREERRELLTRPDRSRSPGPSRTQSQPPGQSTSRASTSSVVFGKTPKLQVPPFTFIQSLPERPPEGSGKIEQSPPRKIKLLPYEQTGMYRRIRHTHITDEEWTYRSQWIDTSKESIKRIEPTYRHMNPYWHSYRREGYDLNNPNIQVKKREDRHDEYARIKTKFQNKYPLHPSRSDAAELREEALELLSRSYPSKYLYEDDHRRIGVVHSLAEFEEIDNCIGLTRDIKRHHFMTIDIEDLNLRGDYRERIRHPITGKQLAEPDHRFYFRRSLYLLIGTLSGRIMLFHMPSLYGDDFDEVMSTWRPIKYMLDYLPPVIRRLLENHRIAKTGSAIIEQEYVNRLKKPGFIPIASACTRRIFHFWHRMRWANDYRPQPGPLPDPMKPLNSYDEGYSLTYAMEFMLDFKLPPPQRGLKKKYQIYFWECVRGQTQDYFKRHTHATHYLYQYADTVAPAAICLVLLLKILSLPADQTFAGQMINFDKDIPVGNAIYRLISPHFRCMPGQKEDVARVLDRLYRPKKFHGKRPHQEEEEPHLQAKQRRIVSASGPSGPGAGQSAIQVTMSYQEGPNPFSYPSKASSIAVSSSMGAYPELMIEAEPLEIPRISFEDGVDIRPMKDRKGVRFDYKRKFVYQEAIVPDPQLPKGCPLCNKEGHCPVDCHVAELWDTWHKRAVRRGKKPASSLPSKYKSCDYPHCLDRLSHTRDVCPALHHLCYECDRRGHFEVECRHLTDLQQLFGTFRTYAPHGVLTKHGVPESKKARASRDRNHPERKQPEPHILEAGFHRCPPELRGEAVRFKIHIYDEELRFIHPTKHIPILYDQPALARIADEATRIAEIKKFPHYVLKTRNELRQEGLDKMAEEYVPAPEEHDLAYQERDQLQRDLDEMRLQREALEKRVAVLERQLEDCNQLPMEEETADPQDQNQAFIYGESEPEIELDTTMTLLEEWEERLGSSPAA